MCAFSDFGFARFRFSNARSKPMKNCTHGGPADPFGGTPVGDTTPAILAGTKRTENSFGIIWPSPRQLRVKNTLRVGHRGPVGRKTTQKPPQNTKKWKKIVKKRLFSRFGHFGQNSDFSRKKSKTGIFFDITKPPLAQIYPKVACESIPTCFGHI